MHNRLTSIFFFREGGWDGVVALLYSISYECHNSRVVPAWEMSGVWRWNGTCFEREKSFYDEEDEKVFEVEDLNVTDFETQNIMGENALYDATNGHLLEPDWGPPTQASQRAVSMDNIVNEQELYELQWMLVKRQMQ